MNRGYKLLITALTALILPTLGWAVLPEPLAEWDLTKTGTPTKATPTTNLTNSASWVLNNATASNGSMSTGSSTAPNIDFKTDVVLHPETNPITLVATVSLPETGINVSGGATPIFVFDTWRASTSIVLTLESLSTEKGAVFGAATYAHEQNAYTTDSATSYTKDTTTYTVSTIQPNTPVKIALFLSSGGMKLYTVADNTATCVGTWENVVPPSNKDYARVTFGGFHADNAALNYTLTESLAIYPNTDDTTPLDFSLPTETSVTIASETATASELAWDPSEPSNQIDATINASVATTLTLDEAITAHNLTLTGSDIAISGSSNLTAATTVVKANTNVSGITGTTSLGAVTVAEGATLTEKATLEAISSITNNGALRLVATAADQTADVSTRNALKNGSGKLILGGETSFTTNLGTIGTGMKIEVEEGDHYLKSNSGMQEQTYPASTDESPAIWVKKGATLTLQTKDIIGWYGSYQPNMVIRNSGNLIWTEHPDSSTGTDCYSGRWVLDNGSCLTISSTNSELRRFVWCSGTEEYPNVRLTSGSAEITKDATIGLKIYNGEEMVVETGSAASDCLTISAPIEQSGTAKLKKTGAGILNLTAANTYTGATTISAGTLRLSNAGTLGTGAVSVASGATLAAEVAEGTTKTLANVISGAGALTVSGSGTLTLTGANTRTGAVTIAEGATLDITDSNTRLFGIDVPQVTSTLTVNGTLKVARDWDWSDRVFGHLLHHTTQFVVDGGTIVLSGSFETNRFFSIGEKGATIQVEDGHSLTFAFDTNYQFEIPENASLKKSGIGSVIMNDPITGAGSFAVDAGTAMFSAAQTYTGLTTVATGATIGGTGSLTGGLTLAAGAIVDATADSKLTVNGALTLNGEITVKVAELPETNKSVPVLNGTLPEGTYTAILTTEAGEKCIATLLQDEGAIIATRIGSFISSPEISVGEGCDSFSKYLGSNRLDVENLGALTITFTANGQTFTFDNAAALAFASIKVSAVNGVDTSTCKIVSGSGAGTITAAATAINTTVDVSGVNVALGAVTVAEGKTLDVGLDTTWVSVSGNGKLQIAKETISLNIAKDWDGNIRNATATSEQIAGLAPVPGAAWVNLTADGGQGGVAATEMSGVYWTGDATGDLEENEGSTMYRVAYSAGNTYQWKNATDDFLDAYLDDGNRARITVDRIPFTTYSVIIYCATDSASRKFAPVTVNDTEYTVDAAGETVEGSDPFGASQGSTAKYATPNTGNAIRVDDLSGQLRIVGGEKSDTARGGIAAIQIVNTGTVQNYPLYKATLTETATYSELEDLTESNDLVVDLTLENGAELIVDKLPEVNDFILRTATDSDVVTLNISLESAEDVRAVLNKITTAYATGIVKVTMGAYTGEAAWMAYEFNGNGNNSGSSKDVIAGLGWDSDRPFKNAEYTGVSGDENRMLHLPARPYCNVSSGYPAACTAVMYAKAGSTANGILASFGSSTHGTGQAITLAVGATPDTGAMRLVHTSGETLGTDLVTNFSVPNSQDAYHLYAFVMYTKADKTHVEIYVDGALLTTYKFNSVINLGPGFQIASIHGGYANTGLARLANDDTATMDFLRVYDCLLSDEMLATLADAYPYTSPSGRATRTVAAADEVKTWIGGENQTVWTQTTLATDGSGETTDTPQAAPNNGTNVELTVSDNTEVAVNAAAEGVTYESLTVAGSGVLTLSAAQDTGMITVSGMTEIETNVTVAADVLKVGTVNIAEGKKLTFDYSGYDFSAIFEPRMIPLTGLATLGTGAAVAVSLPETLPGQIAAAECVFNENTQEYALSVTIKDMPLTAAVSAGETAWDNLSWTVGGVGIATPADDDFANFAINLTMAGTATLSLDAPITVAQVTVEGEGTLTLAGEKLTADGNFAANTTVIAGTATLSAANYTIAADKTLTYTCTSDLALPAISGTGTFVKAGTAIATISKDVTYTNKWQIAEGALRLDGGEHAAAYQIEVLQGATLGLENSGIKLTSDASVITLHSGATMIARNGNTAGAIINAKIKVDATETDGNGALIPAVISAGLYGDYTDFRGAIQGEGALKFVTSDGNQYNVSGVISDESASASLRVIVATTAYLHLKGANTYTGGTEVLPEAKVELNDAGTVGAGDLTVNGTLTGNATIAAGKKLSGAGTINGTVTFANGAVVDATAGVVTVNAVTLPEDDGKVTVTAEGYGTVLKATSGLDAAKFTAPENGILTIVTGEPNELVYTVAITTVPTDVTLTSNALTQLANAAAEAKVEKITSIIGAPIGTGDNPPRMSVAALELFDNVPVTVDDETGVATISYTFGVSGLTALSATTVTENAVTTTTYTLVAKVQLGEELDNLNFADGVTVGLVDAKGTPIKDAVAVTDMTGATEAELPTGKTRYFKYTITAGKSTSSDTFGVKAHATNEATE